MTGLSRAGNDGRRLLKWALPESRSAANWMQTVNRSGKTSAIRYGRSACLNQHPSRDKNRGRAARGMTLTTHVRIVQPTPVKPIFDECRRILQGEHVPFTHEQEKYGPEPHNMRYANQIGAGLHALLWLTYGADGPISDYPEADYEGYVPPRASIDVTFDTAYAYRNTRGGGCSDLHAWIVGELGQWLTARGLTWYWEHEYTGAWYQGAADLPVLGNAALGALVASVSI